MLERACNLVCMILDAIEVQKLQARKASNKFVQILRIMLDCILMRLISKMAIIWQSVGVQLRQERAFTATLMIDLAFTDL